MQQVGEAIAEAAGRRAQGEAVDAGLCSGSRNRSGSRGRSGRSGRRAVASGLACVGEMKEQQEEEEEPPTSSALAVSRRRRPWRCGL